MRAMPHLLGRRHGLGTAYGGGGSSGGSGSTHYGTATLPTSTPLFTSTNTFGSGTTYTPPNASSLATLLLGGTLRGGDVIVLTDGVNYNSTIDIQYFPPVTGASASTPVWVVTSSTAGITAAGVRMAAGNALATPHFRSLSNNNPAVNIMANADYWRFVGIRMDGGSTTTQYGMLWAGPLLRDPYSAVTTYSTGQWIGYGNLTTGANAWVSLQNGNIGNTPVDGSAYWQRLVLADLPTGLILDRCMITSTYANNCAYQIRFDVAEGVIANCYLLSEGGYAGLECKCISSITGMGPWLWDNNYFAAPAINTMPGGASPSHPSANPTDCTVSRNYYYKFPRWFRRNAAYDGSDRTVKNLFEIKTGTRWLVERNVFENAVYGDTGQPYALAIKVSTGDTPTYSTNVTQDITIRYNILKNVFGAISVGPNDAYGGGSNADNVHDVSVYHNYTVGRMGSNEQAGYTNLTSMQVIPVARNVHIEHCTFIPNTTINAVNRYLELPILATAMTHLVVRNVIGCFGTYGVFGDSGFQSGAAAFTGTGSSADAVYFFDPYTQFPGGSSYPTPPFNNYASVASLVRDFDAGDERTVIALANAGYGGRTPGCDTDNVDLLTTGCVSGSW